MNINDALQTLSECDVVIGMNSDGKMKLIKNGFSNNQIRSVNDGLDMLYNLFKQDTEVEFFNEAFYQEFEKLYLKHFKRMNFEACQIISTEEGLWASTG